LKNIFSIVSGPGAPTDMVTTMRQRLPGSLACR
jgi:hypothetical protein